MTTNFFVKTHGLGNEYIVLDQNNIDFKLQNELIKTLCNIHFGIGSDGILLKVPSNKADFGLRIFNPDASEAEKSGNGIRIFSKYLYDYGFAKSKVFTIDTLGGVVTSEVVEEINGKAFIIKVDMGAATFVSREIPVASDTPEFFGKEIQAGNRTFKVHCVSVGNPHCVILEPTITIEEVKEYGPLIENHAMFPNRINVQFVKKVTPREAEILIWERGAGYTLASGSSSSAVSAALYKLGLIENEVTIKMPGGTLKLEILTGFKLRMTGEVREICSGTLSEEFFREN